MWVFLEQGVNQACCDLSLANAAMVFLMSICTSQLPQHYMASLYKEYLGGRWRSSSGLRVDFAWVNLLRLPLLMSHATSHHFVVSREEAEGGSYHSEP